MPNDKLAERIEAAEGVERKAIVEFLRDQADRLYRRHPLARASLLVNAEAIERGDHLRADQGDARDAG